MSSAEWNAIWLSIQVAFVGVLVSLPIGIATGWLLARKRFFGKAVVETIVNLPLVLPPVVTGYLLLVTFGRSGFLGRILENWFGLRFVFDWKGAALAAAVVSLPLMVRAIRVAFSSVDPKLEQAARTLGASPLDTFFTVSLPLARHGVIAGCMLSFARSLGEFGATIMIAGSIPGETQTIPLYIFNQLQVPEGMNGARSIVLFSIAIAVVALFAGERLDRRGVAGQA
ncbi:Molybdenum transport system permease protein ModB [Planctomycetes bacterium CA13]|uniref:Molybdenum transport system permease n=1 Tax=Novipirellula herctigrandis TaxID=2527986 RepID=A0A5C5Z7Y2_9BACT|nr:Molybdenum transport system permease protein ModB [Planctomycetes bacterium CA13]